jgi:hypothetical protein
MCRFVTVIALVFISFAPFAGCSDEPRATSDGEFDTTTTCDACRADQICVAKYDGTCKSDVSCVARTVDCPSNACSSACETAYCSAPYQCQNRAPCGGEPEAAFTCYGP